MSGNVIIGFVTMAVCVTIQCFVVVIMLHTLSRLGGNGMYKITALGASSVLIVVMFIMVTGNLLQIAFWAWLFRAYGEFDDFATAFYHSVVNFSTLGYGDVVMSEQRRLLGALEAVNGVLMFGLTTGVLFAVLNDLMQRAWKQRQDKRI